MKLRKTWVATIVLVLLGLALLASADSKAMVAEQLARYRNLGKAFYENPTTAKEAVEQFGKALELAPDSPRELLNYGLALLRAGQITQALETLETAQKMAPEIPHTWFVLGIEYKKLGQFEKAIAQLEQMEKLVPTEAVTQYNLGVLYKRVDRVDEALKKFARASELDPSLAAPHFQLFNFYRQSKNKEKSAYELSMFKRLKEAGKKSPVAEDMNWSFYAEVLDEVEPLAAENKELAELRFAEAKLSGAADAATAGMLTLDVNASGKPNLLAWSSDGALLYDDDMKPVDDPVLKSLGAVLDIAADDYDNDGFRDLCVATEGGLALLKNTEGKFRKLPVKLPAGQFAQVEWLDYDHDNDSDLFLFGAQSILMRNEGAAGFADKSGDFPFAPGAVVDAMVFRLVPDSKQYDILVSRADDTAVIYKDLLGGIFKAKPLPLAPPKATRLTAADYDNDGWYDLAFTLNGKLSLLLNDDGELKSIASPVSGSPIFVDAENRGRLELIADGKVHRNEGEGKFSAPASANGLLATVTSTSADFDGDGLTDIAGVAPDGSVHVLKNRTASKNKWLQLALSGKKAPVLGYRAIIEVKAGARYQKHMYQGHPLLVGLGLDSEADTVRITWPNGMIQNEMNQAANQTYNYVEEERLSGSCPMIYTWNGRAFQFITDILGVAPMGVRSGEDGHFPLDNDEYIQIPEGTLKARRGAYEIRITQELAEVAYVDQIRLITVDHPAEVEVFTNNKFQLPPFPNFRLHATGGRHYPLAATGSKGQDIRDRLLRTDHRYPDRFERPRRGVAEMHSLEMDFGVGALPANNGFLVLRGWTDWADGSTYFAYSQEGAGLRMPYLQVKDRNGEWATVEENMGVPSGLPKNVVVDLRGKFLSDSREVRIVTNMCLYWDEAFLAPEASVDSLRVQELISGTADLRFRGFARIHVDPSGRQPQRFFYDTVLPAAMWDQTPGMYTRYGEVSELLDVVDDRYVIFGTGDELRLLFDARALPKLPAGWKRDFILGVDGWEKDQDPNTAFSMSVEPLPFHGMSGYPYSEAERYPEDEARRQYREEYNTRPALRLMRPLVSKTGPAGSVSESD